jgi:hypothetical protein
MIAQLVVPVAPRTVLDAHGRLAHGPHLLASRGCCIVHTLF